MSPLSRWRASTTLSFLIPALIVGGALGVAAATSAAPRPVVAASGPAGDPNNGQTLFGSNCASCHGASLEGGIGPTLNPIKTLTGVTNPLDPKYLTDTITNGRPASDGFNGPMPPKGGANLSPQDVQDLVAFIIQRNNTKGPVPLTAQELARSTVGWITFAIVIMTFLTWLLARYNMRWIARRAAARRERMRGTERNS